MDPKDADARIQVLRRLPLEKIVDEDPPPTDYQPSKPGDRADLFVWTNWAEHMRAAEIANIRSMKPREIHARAKRRDIWASLWHARTRPALRAACGRWSELEDVIGLGFGPFPEHVVANEKAFLSITSNPRFPTAPASDDSRMEFVARGMAGIMVGRSPMTGVERLRNMKHRRGGPLWSSEQRRCGCWRCVIAYVYAMERRGLKGSK
jgi:hypothetical protein